MSYSEEELLFQFDDEKEHTAPNIKKYDEEEAHTAPSIKENKKEKSKTDKSKDSPAPHIPALDKNGMAPTFMFGHTPPVPINPPVEPEKIDEENDYLNDLPRPRLKGSF